MVRLEMPPESRSLEIFDLTTPRGSDEEACYPWRVGVILFEEDRETYIQDEYDEFTDGVEPAAPVPDGTVIVAMDLQDEEEETFVQVVRDGSENKRCMSDHPR